MSVESPVSIEMVSIEIDGIPMDVPKGSMIIEASDKAGIHIPRFCYHHKLSIAANCRMCLVDVEKAPKPLPACATPVMDGMKVYTQSRRALDAQHGVMEFLLINHPLDCPICDQGGECELQDLAMGYGRSVSRFTERKRVVKDKNAGPLVQTDMTRCIHCTRCVRFLEEIAGTSEMGGSGRGDRLEIGTCVENSIDSELSGNIIDLCPVGALTNKPFRFAARAWELLARPSVSVHDGVGSTVYHHVRRGKILRTVPRDNEATNESWLTDRDRFSHLGLYAEDRVLNPLVKKDGQWQTVSWDDAITAAADSLRGSGEDLGLLMAPGSATEEFYLGQELARQLGSNNIDHRLREADFSDDEIRAVSPEFQMKISEMESSDAIVLVGSNIRQEAPILGHRLRKAWLAGARISVVNPIDWSFTFETGPDLITPPQHWVAELASLAAALAKVTGSQVPELLRSAIEGAQVGERHEAIARRLHEADNGLVLVGQMAMSHQAASWLRQLAAFIAQASASKLNILPHGGNAVGAWMAGAVPHRGPGGASSEVGKNVTQMLNSPPKTWLLWNFEPDFDMDNPAAAMAALGASDATVAVAEFASDALREVAHVILPLAPLAESEGSLLNLDGDACGFSPAGRVSGDAKPGWKILRRLGAELGLDGFDQVDLAGLQHKMNQRMAATGITVGQCSLESVRPANGLHRVGEVPMYSVDALCRRATSLQETEQAQSMFVGLNPADADRFGLTHGGKARVRQGDNHAELVVRVSEAVPAGAAWVRSATCSTRALGTATGPITVEVA